MNNIKIKNYAWLIIGLALATWIILIFFNQESFSLTKKSFYQIPNVITVNAFIWFVFIKWLWKLKIFKGWLVPFPNLSGSWKGQVIPKNTNPLTGIKYEPVELLVEIKQSFLSIHIRVYSNEMESNSFSSSFILDSETNEKRLCYSYTSKPKSNIRDRSPIHDGTALLTIKDTDNEELEGEYWTSRNTTGEMYLEKVSKKKK